QTYLLGEGFGSALPALVLGEVSPSGKLAETYPKALRDVPCLGDLKVDHNCNLKFRESIFVGYRYYDTADKEVAYPFGYGLSYSKFEYSDLKVVKADDGKVAVCFNIKNVGDMKADEIAQVYVGACFPSKVYRAKKELKEFARVSLEPGETANVELCLDKCAFEYYSADLDKWVTEAGTYKIMIGASSRDIRLNADVQIDSADDLSKEGDYADFAPHYFKANIAEVSDTEFYNVLGYDLDAYLPDSSDLRLTQADAIADATASKPGKRINNALDMVASIPFIPENYKKLVVDSVKTMPLNRMVHASKGIFSDNMADGVVTLLNGGTVVDMAKLMALGLPASAKAIVVPFLQKKATPKPKKKKGI
ncbi:MAG: fibronectin type III-like domain-contianing protein, partial [Clostridia bacterium]|nr:fibronectin type III-like domain-contianing protein [Clostridia bacterium]